MNWEAAIARNRQALLEIILALMASVGLGAPASGLPLKGGAKNRGRLTTLPFNLYCKALTIIRVAESAVRRLIFIAAHDLKLRGFNPKGGALISPGAPASGLPLKGGAEKLGEMSAKPTERGAPDRPSNQYDRLQNRVRIVNNSNTTVAPLSALSGISPSGAPASGLPLKGGVEMREISAPPFGPTLNRANINPTNSPHISFPLIEPLKTFTEDPRDFASMYHGDSSSSREPTPATALGNRLLALHFALTNIERQAKRLLRWEARRDAALMQKIPHRMTPMRPGVPPFYSRKPVTEIEKILKECHGLTHYIRERRGTIP